MRAEEYLTILTEQIRCKRARGAVWQEVAAHVEEQKEAFLREGMEEAEAEAAAVRDMGDPVEAGVALDRIHRPRMAWGLIGAVMLLGILGFTVQCLLQQWLTQEVIIPGNLGTHMFYLFLGFAVMLGVCCLDYTRIAVHAKLLTLALAGFQWIGVTWFGYRAGDHIYVRLLVVFQMDFLSFLFVPLYGAILYQYRNRGYEGLGKALLWMAPGFLTSLCFGQKSFFFLTAGTMLLLVGMAVWQGWFRVSRRKVLLAMAGGLFLVTGAAGALIAFAGSAYQQERLYAMLSLGENFTVARVLQILEGSQWLGRNEALNGVYPMFYGSSDYVLLFVVAGFGIAAGLVLLFLLGLLFGGFLRLSRKQTNPLGRMMGTGCGLLFCLQLVLYALNNLGYLFPAAYCPFLTYGGTGSLVTYGLLGLMLSIYRYDRVVPKRCETAHGKKSRIRVRLVVERES